MKMVRRGAQPVGGDTGLETIKQLASTTLPDAKAAPRGTSRDILAGFTDGR